MKFEELNLELPKETKVIKINDCEVHVKSYLPIEKKVDMIQYIIECALDEKTGCFSPIRLELWFGIAICKWYTDLDFEDFKGSPQELYDLLESNSIIDRVLGAIPEAEFIQQLVEDTTKDMARYNSSAAGILQSMSENADTLSTYMTDALDKVKNAEGIENLKVITDIMGRDNIVVKKD